MSFLIIVENIFICLLFPLLTYEVTRRRNSEVLEACEGNENLKKNAKILSKEEVKVEFGVWVLPHKQTIHLCAEFISRVIKPMLLLTFVEMICFVLKLLSSIPAFLNKTAGFIMLGCILVQCIICCIHMFRLNSACKKLVDEYPAEDGQDVVSD